VAVGGRNVELCGERLRQIGLLQGARGRRGGAALGGAGEASYLQTSSPGNLQESHR